ncbi:hypothetical protein PHMEG_0005904 [Phytophthora megakarya]|uniref:Uncharacterized protein n=1 Tax=Phytophthora megakarya TaxID=4795 RepID=A0A225WQ09_9STRA|nr:hypothetical protein PHMEG_0005904 [Phytophthora megakarya]
MGFSPTKPPITRPWGYSIAHHDPKLALVLAFQNTTKDWKSNEVAKYRATTLSISSRFTKEQLIKSQDKKNEQRLRVFYDVGDSVSLLQLFLAKRSEKKKKLFFSWHGLYRVLGQVGGEHLLLFLAILKRSLRRLFSDEARRVLQPKAVLMTTRHLEKVVTGTPTKSGADDYEVSKAPLVKVGGPHFENDLPADSYVKCDLIGHDKTAFIGAPLSIMAIVAKRVVKRLVEYLVLK